MLQIIPAFRIEDIVPQQKQKQISDKYKNKYHQQSQKENEKENNEIYPNSKPSFFKLALH